MKPNKNTLLIISGIIILILLGYIGYNKFQEYQLTKSNEVYIQGFNDGTINLINQINTRGEIPVINPQNTTQINWITLQEVCG